MKIGVLSDTHIPRSMPSLPKEVVAAFKKVDLILHAGDLVSPSVLKELNKLAKTKAVCGNMDSPELVESLPESLIIKVEGCKIGLMHGYGSPSAIEHTVMREFGDKVDVIVFGHSHIPVNEKRGRVLLFNPGSPTDKMFAPYNSYGILEVDKGKVKARIVKMA